MPQMAPINWLSLFIMFTLIFLLFNMMNYYLFTPIIKKISQSKEKKSNTLNWKW